MNESFVGQASRLAYGVQALSDLLDAEDSRDRTKVGTPPSSPSSFSHEDDVDETAATSEKKKRWLLSIFEKLSLPFLDDETLDDLPHPTEKVRGYFNFNSLDETNIKQFNLKRVYLMLVMAEVESHLPRLFALIDNFSSLCEVAARYRRHPETAADDGNYVASKAPSFSSEEKSQDARPRSTSRGVQTVAPFCWAAS